MATAKNITRSTMRDWKEQAKKLAAAVALPAAIGGTVVTPDAEAGGFYTYSGHMMTTISGGVPVQVTGSVSFNDTVTANFTGNVDAGAITYWSLSANDASLSSASGDQLINSGFALTNGQITSWSFSAAKNDPNLFPRVVTGKFGNAIADAYSGSVGSNLYAQTENDPGSWAGAAFATQTPLPKTLGGSNPPANPGSSGPLGNPDGFGSPGGPGLPGSPGYPGTGGDGPTNTADNQACGCADGNNNPPLLFGDPVNVATGNNYQTETDFAGVAGTGLMLRRYYNSQDSTNVGMGNGWHSTWHRSLDYPFGMIAALSPTGGSASVLRVTRADGHIDTFHNTSGVWTSDADVTSTVTPVFLGGVQTGWKVRTEDDSTEYYNTAGQMTALADRAGNVTTLTYVNNRLDKVTGPFGHTLSFGYDGNNRISTVTLPDNTLLQYGYDATNNLVSVTYPDNTVRGYVYNEAVNTSGASLPMTMTGIVEKTSINDPNGVRFATFKTDAVGRTIYTEHAGGQEAVSITYNADRSTTMTDARGNAHTYTFQNLFGVMKPSAITGVPDPSSGGQAFGFDPATGFLTSHKDFNGNQTNFTRNARGQETSRTEAVGTTVARTITTDWHANFHLPTKITAPSGAANINRVTTLNWEPTQGTLTSEVVQAVDATTGAVLQSRTWNYTYTATGQPKTVDGPRTDVADITTFGYSTPNGGLLTSITNALGQTTTFGNFDGAGRPQTITNPNGLATQIAYNPRGMVKQTTIGQEVTKFDYYPATGLLQKLTRPDGSFFTFGYNDAHEMTRITDAAGNYMQLTRDPAGNVKQTDVYTSGNVLKQTHKAQFDAVNRLAQDIGALNQTTTFDRDPNGNVTGITDPLGNKTINSIDALNRLTTSTDPNGGKTSIVYNPDNSVKTATDPRGNTNPAYSTGYTYDGLGNQTKIQSPDSGTTTRTFDATGNVLSSIDAKGQETKFTWDALNRPKTKTYADNTSVTFNYDETFGGTSYGIGHLTSMTDPSGSTKWTFDLRGHEIQKDQTIKVGTGANPPTVTLTTKHAFNAVTGLETSTILPSQTALTYGYYSATKQPQWVNLNGGTLLSGIQWQPFGGPVSWVQGSGTQTHVRTLDTDGRTAALSFTNTSATGGRETVALNYMKGAQDTGNLVMGMTGNTVAAKAFDYDPLERLTNYSGSGVTRTYTPDENGNRVQFTSTVGSTTSTANYLTNPNSNRLESRTVNVTATTNYATDNNGSITGDGTRGFTHNAAGQLSHATNGATVADYTFNGLGERVSKTVNNVTTLFVQAGTQLVGEYNAAGQAIQENVYLAGMPVAMRRSNTTYYVNPDHLGAPRTITTITGDKVWAWDRDPFGNGDPVASGSFVNNLRFPGQYADAETGLFHNNARDYDRGLGRYIQADPIGLKGGMNPYVYAGGNPVNSVDPSGLITVVQVYKDLSYVFYTASWAAAVTGQPELAIPFYAAGAVMQFGAYLEEPTPVATSVSTVAGVCIDKALEHFGVPGQITSRAIGTFFDSSVDQLSEAYKHDKEVNQHQSLPTQAVPASVTPPSSPLFTPIPHPPFTPSPPRLMTPIPSVFVPTT